MIGAHLRRYRKEQLYLIWDTETADLNLHFTLPWQLSYAIANAKEIIDIKTSFIHWPGLVVSEEAARITRFDRALYENSARPAKDVLNEFDALLYDARYESVFQNGLGFDCSVHRNWRRECGLPADWSYLYRAIDTLPLIRARKKGWVPDTSSPEAFLAWQYKGLHFHERGLKASLGHTGKDMGIVHDYDSLHDAASDTVLLHEVFKRLLFEVEF